MSTEVNAWQQAVYDVIFNNQLVNPKRVAQRLQKHSDYLSDICRRDRVDPFAVANAIMLEARAMHGDHNPTLLMRACMPFITALLVGTGFQVRYTCPPPPAGRVDLADLREQIAPLLSDLSGAIDSLCQITKDGSINGEDDPSIAEFDHKASRLMQLLGAVQTEVHRRRAEVQS